MPEGAVVWEGSSWLRSTHSISRRCCCCCCWLRQGPPWGVDAGGTPPLPLPPVGGIDGAVVVESAAATGWCWLLFGAADANSSLRCDRSGPPAIVPFWCTIMLGDPERRKTETEEGGGVTPDAGQHEVRYSMLRTSTIVSMSEDEHGGTAEEHATASASVPHGTA